VILNVALKMKPITTERYSMLNKRDFFKTTGGALAGVGLAACGSGTAAPTTKSAFVLLHGGWHGSWCWERVIRTLAGLGHLAVAPDLAGHGLNAKFPSSYLAARPSAALTTEASLVGSITLDDYVNGVQTVIDQVRAAGYERVVLVGHSMAGIILNRIGEVSPGKIQKLIYLAGNLPKSDVPIGIYFSEPENAAATLGPTFIGDAFTTGAFRIDPRSASADYRALLTKGFYNDANQADSLAAINLLTPDLPTTPLVTPIKLSTGAWGALKKHYIKCLRDNALPVALADRFITETNAFVPSNPIKVHTLDTGHSPFITAPVTLANLLSTISESN
jgi:pimeloyl-ACP methyl ester carboxylesterase